MSKLHAFTKIILPAALAAALLLAGCDAGAPRGIGTEASAPEAQSTPSGASTPQPAEGGPAAAELPELTVVRSGFMDNPYKEDGFFMVDLPQSDMWQNLMFYDYKTLEQRYFCDAPGCTHDHTGCTSYIDGSGGINPFTYGGHLYINYAGYNDGSSDDNNLWPSAIVKYNRDGTGGEVMVTYPPYELQLDTIYCDGEAFYFSASDGFIRLDLDTYEKTVITPVSDRTPTPMNATQTVSLGCVYENELLYMRIYVEPDQQVFGDTIVNRRELLKFCVQTGEYTSLRVVEPYEYLPWQYGPDGVGYYIEASTGEVRSHDLKTGEDTLVTDHFTQYAGSEVREHMVGMDDEVVEETYYYASAWNVERYEDWLILELWDNRDGTGSPQTSTWGISLSTGEIKEITFGSFYNGYVHPMNIFGETPYGLLVIEEHRKRMIYSTGTGGEPYNFESEYWVFGLITLEDFVNSNPNFKTIAPVPYSGT